MQGGRGGGYSHPIHSPWRPVLHPWFNNVANGDILKQQCIISGPTSISTPNGMLINYLIFMLSRSSDHPHKVQNSKVIPFLVSWNWGSLDNGKGIKSKFNWFSAKICQLNLIISHYYQTPWIKESSWS